MRLRLYRVQPENLHIMKICAVSSRGENDVKGPLTGVPHKKLLRGESLPDKKVVKIKSESSGKCGTTDEQDDGDGGDQYDGDGDGGLRYICLTVWTPENYR